VNKPWAGSNRYKISAPHAAGRRVATPGRFTLTTFLCTLQVSDFGETAFARWLQHSIQGAWLALTLAGVSPASHQTISSPHVQRFVIPHLRVADCLALMNSIGIIES